MIPAHLQPDLCDAWREGGRRAFCYLESLFEHALITRDFAHARDVAWLLDVLMEKEISQCKSIDMNAVSQTSNDWTHTNASASDIPALIDALSKHRSPSRVDSCACH